MNEPNDIQFVEGLITQVQYLDHPKTGPYARITLEGTPAIVIVKGVKEEDKTPFLNSYGTFQGELKTVKGEQLLISDNDCTIDPNAMDGLVGTSPDLFEQDAEIARLQGLMLDCLQAGRDIEPDNWLAVGLAIFNKWEGAKKL